MIYMLLYTHLCHYTGGDFGETFSYISCHLFIYRLHVNGIAYTFVKFLSRSIPFMLKC